MILANTSFAVVALISSEGSGFWSRLMSYLDYPGFEAWKFVNLAIFAGLLVFILFRKANLGAAFKARRESIKNELEKARQERDQALAKLKEVEERLASLDDQVVSIKEASKREAAAERERIALSTKEEIAKLTAQGQREIENAARTAKRDLRTFTAEQSVRMAEELLKRELRPEDDARLISQSIEEMRAGQ